MSHMPNVPSRTQLAARFWYRPVYTSNGWEGNDREGPGTGKATTQATGKPPPAADRYCLSYSSHTIQSSMVANGWELTIIEEGSVIQHKPNPHAQLHNKRCKHQISMLAKFRMLDQWSQPQPLQRTWPSWETVTNTLSSAKHIAWLPLCPS